MKTRRFSVRRISVYVMIAALLLIAPVYAQEKITVTQDQLELRSDPADNDENILGTLRADTPITFTGKVSGKWYQITAPNGQTGWVHQSGVSRPPSLVKPTPTPKPAATPKPASAPKAEKTPAKPTSRTVPKPAEKQAEKPSKTQQATLNELETLNNRYKAQLEEKDLRIAELSKELDEVETQLTDAGKTATDLEQLRKTDDAKLTEIQTQIASLNETIQQKEDALLAQKVEFATLQEELNKQVSSQQMVSLQRMLLLISLPLNMIGLMLLGYFGIRHIASKQEKRTEALSHLHEMESPEIAPTTPPVGKPVKQPSADSLTIQIGRESDPQLKDLDVIMTTSAPAPLPVAAAVAPPEEEIVEIEETVIDLGDALPGESSEQLAMDISEPGVIITEETIIVDEPIEIVHEDIPEQEIEPIPAAAEPAISPTIEEQLDMEEMPEIPEIPAPVEEEPEDVELEFDDEDIEETPIEAEAEEGLAIDDDNMEALLEDTQDLEQPTDMEGLLEAGELEEPIFEEVEIAGERFETLPEKGTQMIAMENEDEEPYAETPVEDNLELEEDIENEDEELDSLVESHLEEEMMQGEESYAEPLVEGYLEEDIMLDSSPGIIDDADEELAADARTIAPETREMSKGEEALEFDVEEPAEPSFANLRTAGEIDELLDMLESPIQPERSPKTDDSRGFAEPSPYLIEPEELETTATIEEAQPEPKYTIELTKVGRNRDHVLHILSKVQGLPKTAEELIASTPCTIARGANKQDAQNFQMLMQKFGADVRLTQH